MRAINVAPYIGRVFVLFLRYPSFFLPHQETLVMNILWQILDWNLDGMVINLISFDSVTNYGKILLQKPSYRTFSTKQKRHAPSSKEGKCFGVSVGQSPECNTSDTLRLEPLVVGCGRLMDDDYHEL